MVLFCHEEICIIFPRHAKGKYGNTIWIISKKHLSKNGMLSNNLYQIINKRNCWIFQMYHLAVPRVSLCFCFVFEFKTQKSSMNLTTSYRPYEKWEPP